jgi:hypothetical protein
MHTHGESLCWESHFICRIKIISYDINIPLQFIKCDLSSFSPRLPVVHGGAIDAEGKKKKEAESRGDLLQK